MKYLLIIPILFCSCTGKMHFGKWDAKIEGYCSYSDIELVKNADKTIDIMPINVEFICDVLGNGDDMAYERLRDRYGDYQSSKPSFICPAEEPCIFAYTIDYHSVDVTCSRQWNDKYAKNGSIADIIQLKARSYWLQMKYTPDSWGIPEYVTLQLSEVSADDLMMLGICYKHTLNYPIATLIISEPPAEAGEYPVTVKMTTADGRIFEKSITLVYTAE